MYKKDLNGQIGRQIGRQKSVKKQHDSLLKIHKNGI